MKNTKPKDVRYFLAHPPIDPTLKRFVKYAQYQVSSKDSEKKLAPKQKFLLQQFQLFTYKDDFQEKVSSFRKKLKMPLGGFPNFDTAFYWVQGLDKRSLDLYERELGELHNELYINGRWVQMVELWVLFNTVFSYRAIPQPFEISYFDDPVTEQPALFWKIYSDTQQDDIVKAWKKIEMYKIEKLSKGGRKKAQYPDIPQGFDMKTIRKENQKDRARNNWTLNCYMRAYGLRKQGKKYQEIADTLYAEKLTKDKDYSKVGNYLKRFQNALDQIVLN